MPAPWNDSTDKQLLLTVIHLVTPGPPKWGEVASLMGKGYTTEAVRQHFAKLKKESTALFGEPATNGATPKAVSAKQSRKKGATETPSSKSTGKRKKGMSDSGDADDEEGSESPLSKKVKPEPTDEIEYEEEV